MTSKECRELLRGFRQYGEEHRVYRVHAKEAADRIVALADELENNGKRQIPALTPLTAQPDATMIHRSERRRG
jgi:hypothetical protein